MKKNIFSLIQAIAFSCFIFFWTLLASSSIGAKNQILQNPTNNSELTKVLENSKNSNQSLTTAPLYKIKNKEKIKPEKIDLHKGSNNFKIPTNKKEEIKLFSDIKFLKQFAINNSALQIHNKALELLKKNNNKPAILLLKKNFYQNLFPASYFTLQDLEEPVFFSYLVLLLAFIILSLITISFFILYLKSPNPFYLKNLLGGISVFFILLAFQFFTLKNKAGLLEESHLQLAPVKASPNTVLITPLEDLTILKKQGDWLKLKNKNNETGWILNQKVFQFF